MRTFLFKGQNSSLGKRKISLIFFLLVLSFFASAPFTAAFSAPPSIEIISFPSGMTYFPKGSISVLFEPKGVFPRNNVFRLEMSDGSGDFTNATVIASKEDFFIPILKKK